MTRECRVVFLRITTWRGYSLGATHWSGQLSGYVSEDEHKSVKITRPMTSEEAVATNKCAHEEGLGIMAHPGDPTDGLRDEQDVLATGLDMWQDAFPMGLILVSSGGGYPARVLVAPDEAMKEALNAIYSTWERIADTEGRRASPITLDLIEIWESLFDGYLDTLIPATQMEATS